MKTRTELLKSKGYWLAKIQTELFREIEDFKREKNMNNSQLAAYLGCSKGYISQLLNGDFDHKISKLIELSLAIGKVPQIEYMDIDQYVKKDDMMHKAIFNAHTCIIPQMNQYSSYIEKDYQENKILLCA